ncbi:MAG: tRNA-dihydrouridine synthase family protein [Deferribacteres bacterium]|nr:tRNA-dihydrouridine synthase family protein [Deferribacteres bacterium]
MRVKLALAPMVNLTHAAFRELVAHFGGCRLFFTEMVNVRHLKSLPPSKDPYLFPAERDRPLVVQLVGREPSDFEFAVRRLEELGYTAGYNLNLGCTKGRFQRYGWGASLLEEPSLVDEILSAMSSSTEREISVKMRVPKGFPRGTFPELVEVFERWRVSFLVVHARSPEDGFKRPARWQLLKRIKEQTSLEVWGNGDVFSPEDTLRMVEETGVDGVVIGRAALIRPWIFRDVEACLGGKNPLPFEEAAGEAVELFPQYLMRFLPERWWSKRLDAFLYWFLQNFSGALFYFRKLLKCGDFNSKVLQVKELVEKAKDVRSYPVAPFLPVR